MALPRCYLCGGLKRSIGGYGSVQALCSCSKRAPVAAVAVGATAAKRGTVQDAKMQRGAELTAAGKTAREIAAELGCSEGYVYALRNRAKKAAGAD